jgi:hypothetical protein
MSKGFYDQALAELETAARTAPGQATVWGAGRRVDPLDQDRNGPLRVSSQSDTANPGGSAKSVECRAIFGIRAAGVW